MALTFWEIADVVQATNNWKQWSDFTINTIEFDSRQLASGSLFIPLGGKTDGHQFIMDARSQGAKAALWSKESSLAPEGFPILEVVDTLKAMQDLAMYYLKKLAPQVIAVTGSNGKTTTKDMIAAVLAKKYITYKTQGNYNNQIGLPYTILHMPEETEMLVLEMGMDHADEIDFLSQLASPTVAAITMIGEAHIENLGSRQEIAKEKMGITKGLVEDGLLIIPENEPLLKPLTANSTQTIKTFGFTNEADFVECVQLEEKNKTTFKLSGYQLPFTIPVPGKYNVDNACIALIIGKWFQVPEKEMQQTLAEVHLTKNRTEWVTANNGVEILSDVYNANPTAVSLVLDSFGQMFTNGRRIVVLGDMLELGATSKMMHQQLSKHLFPAIIQEVFLYGTEMKNLFLILEKTYGNHVHYYPKMEKEHLIVDLKATLQPNDLLLVKGSNGMRLTEVIEALTKKEMNRL